MLFLVFLVNFMGAGYFLKLTQKLSLGPGHSELILEMQVLAYFTIFLMFEISIWVRQLLPLRGKSELPHCSIEIVLLWGISCIFWFFTKA